jgi:hypothetical protein
MTDFAVIKPLTSIITPNTTVTSTFGGNKLIKLTHTGAVTTRHIITCNYANNDTRWTIALTGGQDIILEKDPTDQITSNATDTTVSGVAIAYRN